MIIEVETTSDLEARLMDIYRQCEDIGSCISAYLKVIRMDGADQDASGCWRMIDIIESKIQDLAR